MLNFLVVGTGKQAIKHLKTLNSINETNVLAIIGRNQERGISLAKEFNLKFYNNLATALTQENIDVVIIATEPESHGDFALTAIEAGKHILIEKPLDISLEKAEKIISAAKNKNIKVGVVYQMIYGEAIQAVKNTITQGLLGEIFSAHISLRWKRTNEYYNSGALWKKQQNLGGGVIFNQAIHFINLIQYLLGEVNSVSCFLNTTANLEIQCENNVVAILNFKNKALATLQATTVVNNPLPDLIEINGAKASVVIEGTRIKHWGIKNNTPSFANKLNEKIFSKLPYQMRIAFSKKYLQFSKEGTLIDQIKNFLKYINSNTQPEISIEDSLSDLKIVKAMYESAQQGKAIKIL